VYRLTIQLECRQEVAHGMLNGTPAERMLKKY
jgi:hypothetical protein